MRRATTIAVLAVSSLLTGLTSSALLSQTRDIPSKKQMGRPIDASQTTNAAKELVSGRPEKGAEAATTYTLAQYSFDDGVGGPDTEGWTTVDGQAQVDTFFHVDDFAGLAPDYTPLAGSQSLWCGVRAGPETCHYATAPGYGDNWDQMFESVSYTTTGNVTVEFLLSYDCEPAYDFGYFEYLSVSDVWREALTVDGLGSGSQFLVILEDSLATSTKFRFRFRSDVMYSDEDGVYPSDGAMIVDNLTITDGSGPVDSQDFETESPGDLQTTDGDWQAKVPEPFGVYAALEDGATVLQEDPGTTNLTYLWGFFSGSTYDYSCGGHPEQIVVPFTDNPGSTDPYDYLNNEIWSPWISLTEDENGAPVPAPVSVALSYDLYGDHPMDNLVFYRYNVRSKVGGCAGSWNVGGPYFDALEIWYERSHEIIDRIDPGATEIQIAFNVTDYCFVWCGTYGTGACHSHGPLFDNVVVEARVGPDTLVVTNTNADGPGSLYQALLDARAYATHSTILFDIPGSGVHTISPEQLPSMLYPTTLDGTSQPGYAGTPLIRIRGDQFLGSDALIMLGDSEILGLDMTEFGDGYCIKLLGNNCVVEACELSHSDGGVYMSGDNNTVGGTTTDLANSIYDNYLGVGVSSGTGNTIRLNTMYNNDSGGIDLNLDGPTANDALDADTGPNGLQNFPVLTDVDVATGDISGELDSSPNTLFAIDVYVNRSGCHASGYGEGEEFIGSTTVTTDGSGHGEFTLPWAQPSADPITATATDPAGNTSEFSECFTDSRWYVVTETVGIGTGTLNWAIINANINWGMDRIVFDIPGPGPHTIQPTTPLSSIMQSVIIDGYSQPGASPNTNATGMASNAVIKIEIDGSLAGGPGVEGLNIFTDDCIVRGLAVNNFSGPGIRVDGDNNKVVGNFIGTDVTGTSAEPNEIGLKLAGGSNEIGGDEPSEINVISGNTSEGIQVLDRVSGWGTEDFNVIGGNIIGADATGTAALGNGSYGIGIDVTAPDDIPVTIGGSSAMGNLIAYNGSYGVRAKIGNMNQGEVSYNTIHSNDKGVVLYQGHAAISRNSIHSNTTIGIDLHDDGHDTNDPLDADTGENGRQNYPVLTSAVPGSIEISGSLHSEASENYTIEFFASPSGNQGAIYLGEQNVTTDGSGDTPFAATLLANVPGGYQITATARKTSNGYTSEFSLPVEFVNTPAGTNVGVEPVDEETFTAPVEVTFDNVTTQGNTSLDLQDTGPGGPGGFLIGDSPVYYELSTTATFVESITVCITYDEADIPGDEEDLVLWHYDTSLPTPDWVDITTSLDTGANVICGRTDHLSPFVLAVPDPASGTGPSSMPSGYALYQNVPNPFNPTTVIHYDVPPPGGKVTLRVYDVSGRLVQTLVDEYQSAGVKRAEWNGRGRRGALVASGVYFYRMEAPGFAETRKMLLLK